MSDEERQLTVRMPKSLHKALKVLCAEEGLVLNNVANEAITEWIAKRKAKSDTSNQSTQEKKAS